jgi:dolichol-phosphate mannosyltransferase
MTLSPHVKGSLTVMMAAYNEAENLAVLLPKINAVISRLTPDHEILVVDTNTPLDDTRAVCVQNGAVYLNRENSNNYGDAIRTGINHSQGQYVINMDSDGSHDPAFIEKLWNERERADIVIASRYMAGGKTNNPGLLVFMSRILNIVFKGIVQLPALDVSNSFRLYNGDKLRQLTLTFTHFDIIEEILAKMIWENDPPARVCEIPFEFQKRLSGKSKRNFIVFSYNFFLAIFKIIHMRKESRRK